MTNYILYSESFLYFFKSTRLRDVVLSKQIIRKFNINFSNIRYRTRANLEWRYTFLKKRTARWLVKPGCYKFERALAIKNAWRVSILSLGWFNLDEKLLNRSVKSLLENRRRMPRIYRKRERCSFVRFKKWGHFRIYVLLFFLLVLSLVF